MKEIYTVQDTLAIKGIIAPGEIPGLAETPFRFAELIEARSIFLCRLKRGSQTLVGRHLALCLRAVCCGRDFTPPAQALYDWLSENQGATLEAMGAGCGLAEEEMRAALTELQRYLAAGPIKVLGFGSLAKAGPNDDYIKEDSLLWATDEYLFAGILPGAQYNDIGYCMQELRQLLQEEFDDWEINRLMYRSV